MSEQQTPVEGDQYQCEQCGFTVLVSEPCTCDNGAPFLSCCDEGMKHKPSNS